MVPMFGLEQKSWRYLASNQSRCDTKIETQLSWKKGTLYIVTWWMVTQSYSIVNQLYTECRWCVTSLKLWKKATLLEWMSRTRNHTMRIDFFESIYAQPLRFATGSVKSVLLPSFHLWKRWSQIAPLYYKSQNNLLNFGSTFPKGRSETPCCGKSLRAYLV